MKKYYFRSNSRNVTTTFEATAIFWVAGAGANPTSGVAVMFVKGGNTVAIIGLLPGDIVVEEGAWKDLEEQAPFLEKPKDKVN